VAIVSANAFDKGLDNDAGITPADFITKPVRLDELLDWLGRQLGLQWQAARATASPPAAAPAQAGPPTGAPRPPKAQLMALQDMVNLGYPRGVQRLLDDILAAQPDTAAWLAPLQALARTFEFDRMTPWIQDALHTADAD